MTLLIAAFLLNHFDASAGWWGAFWVLLVLYVVKFVNESNS